MKKNRFFRLPRFMRRMIVFIRRHMRRLENKLDEKPPHPAVGIIAIMAGAALIAAGIIMLFVPGQGLLTIALGIAFGIIGIKIFRGEYGPERKARERERKIKKKQHGVR